MMEVGPPDATEAAVFVHGNPGPGSDFLDLIQRVGEFARAVMLDVPDTGRPTSPRTSTTPSKAMRTISRVWLRVSGSSESI